MTNIRIVWFLPLARQWNRPESDQIIRYFIDPLRGDECCDTVRRPLDLLQALLGLGSPPPCLISHSNGTLTAFLPDWCESVKGRFPQPRTVDTNHTVHYCLRTRLCQSLWISFRFIFCPFLDLYLFMSCCFFPFWALWQRSLVSWIILKVSRCPESSST